MTKFKIGDKVEFIGEGNYTIRKGVPAIKGDVYTIEEVTDDAIGGGDCYEFVEGDYKPGWLNVEINFRKYNDTMKKLKEKLLR